jgi:uncharacterized protein
MSMGSTERRLHVPARTGAAIEVATGELLTVIDVQGKQVCDFFAFNRTNLDEVLSPTLTRTQLLRLQLRPGDLLYSNARLPMFELLEDTVGRHDLIVAPCDQRRYEVGFGMPNHANCRNNCAVAMAPYGLTYARVPDPINFFMNVSIAPDGTLAVAEPLTKAGDYVRLRALMDLIVAVSACPADMNATNAFNPTDLELVVTAG